MMRMIIMQMIFGALNKAGKVTRSGKVLVIVLVCGAMIIRDLATFFKVSNPNIYGQIGLYRSTPSLIFEDTFE